jgi:hypothetical protein
MSGILAEYDSVGAAIAGIERLRAMGHDDLEVFSPIPYEGLEEAMGIVSSPVRRWALIGGITGFATAFALTALTSLAYPLITQGKPIVSLPAYFIIMFELTILFTGLFGFAGVMFHTRKTRRRISGAYRESFSVDRYGVFVPGEAGSAIVEGVMRDTGAVAVEPEVSA